MWCFKTIPVMAEARIGSPAVSTTFPVMALIASLLFCETAKANGSIAFPTPRPWGKFVPVTLEKQTLKRSRAVCQYLRRHHGLSHLASVAIVGHLIQESKAKPTGIRGDRGSAYGIAQWRGIRFKALKRFAARTGRKWQDLHAQLDFIVHELKTSESYAGRALKTAATLEQASIAFMRYERPQGYTYANPRGGMAWSKRMSNAAYMVRHGHCSPDTPVLARIETAEAR